MVKKRIVRADTPGTPGASYAVIQAASCFAGAVASRMWLWDFVDLQTPAMQKRVVPLLLEVMEAYHYGVVYTKLALARSRPDVTERTVSTFLDEAAAIGAIEFQQSNVDGRIHWVVPTERLIKEYNKDAVTFVVTARNMLTGDGISDMRSIQQIGFDVLKSRVVGEIKRARNIAELEVVQVMVDTELVALIPQSPAAHLKLARSLLKRDPGAALAAVSSAIAITGGGREESSLQGQALFYQGLYDEALQTFEIFRQGDAKELHSGYLEYVLCLVMFGQVRRAENERRRLNIPDDLIDFKVLLPALARLRKDPDDTEAGAVYEGIMGVAFPKQSKPAGE